MPTEPHFSRDISHHFCIVINVTITMNTSLYCYTCLCRLIWETSEMGAHWMNLNESLYDLWASHKNFIVIVSLDGFSSHTIYSRSEVCVRVCSLNFVTLFPMYCNAQASANFNHMEFAVVYHYFRVWACILMSHYLFLSHEANKCAQNYPGLREMERETSGRLHFKSTGRL